MGMHRRNKAPRPKGDRTVQPWFTAHIERQRRRKDIAKASKRKNRRN